MISSKTLIKLAKKWQRLAALKRKMLPFPKTTNDQPCSSFSKAKKGHFVVYSFDEKRFMIPLAYLQNDVLSELLDVAMEFGMKSNGPITLPWDASFIECALSLIQWHVAEDLQKALLVSMARNHCLLPLELPQEQRNRQPLICCF